MPSTVDEPRRPRPVRAAPVWADPPPEAALRRMVGAAPDGSLDELRTAYDLAMHRATRSGDHQHALALSRAYDRLPTTTRGRLYPTSRSALPVRAGASPRRQHGVRRRSRGSWPRRLGYGALVLAVLGLAVAGSITHYRQHRDSHPVHQQVVRPGAPVIVPPSAPTGADGLVTLVCQPAPGSGGYAMTAPRGAVVQCANGAAPTVG